MTGDYAPDGLVGVAVPQANPVAEQELRVLLPPTVGLLATRLVSTRTEPGERFRDYAGSLEAAVSSFDTAPLRAFGFACTAPSYLLDRTTEADLFERATQRAGYPVLPVTGAVAEALRHLHIDRIALVTPYPRALDEAAARYWTERGVTVAARQRVPIGSADTRAIYDQPSQAAVAAAAGVHLHGAGAVLISGTGLASLAAVRDARTDVPVLSSNLCLGWALLRRLAVIVPTGDESVLLGGWSSRLDATSGGR